MIQLISRIKLYIYILLRPKVLVKAIEVSLCVPQVDRFDSYRSGRRSIRVKNKAIFLGTVLAL